MALYAGNDDMNGRGEYEELAVMNEGSLYTRLCWRYYGYKKRGGGVVSGELKRGI